MLAERFYCLWNVSIACGILCVCQIGEVARLHSDSREDGQARLQLIDQLSTGFSFARLTRLSAAPDWGPQIEA